MIWHKGPFQWDYYYQKKCKDAHFNLKNSFENMQNRLIWNWNMIYSKYYRRNITSLQNYWNKVFNWLPLTWFHRNFAFQAFFKAWNFDLIQATEKVKNSCRWGKCLIPFLKSILNSKEEYFSIHKFDIVLFVYTTDTMHIS